MAKVVDKQYIIAIGASAGGLEAISAFFDHTPLDAVSYIVIQHLSPDFKSQMGQIISRHTKLEVIEAENYTEIQSNKVYFIPSNKFMAIENGRLILTDKKDIPKPHMTIDHFFSSLAVERGDRAIGVILSGTGDDGSRGVEAIKNAGGMVIIQDPDTAQYSDMPLAAIKTGSANIILAPEAMPRHIEEYVAHGKPEKLTKPVRYDISEGDLDGILELITGILPLDFSDYKRPTILRRIKRRMGQQNFIRIKDYFSYLQENPNEIELLANDFLIGVTSFFRDPEAFKIIEDLVIPDLINNKSPGDVLKIWIAGCSSGEEAYTFAILIREYLDKVNKDIEVKIFATDISVPALAVATKGQYSSNIETAISPERLQNYFDFDGKSYKIKPNIRKMIIFAQHDLVKNSPFCNIDLISCRNLLIYLNSILQRKVFSLLHFGLKKDGYLFLGPSENAAVLIDDFNEISNKWNILKSNKSGRTVKFDNYTTPIIEGLKKEVTNMNKKTKMPASKLSVVDEINLAILDESGFSGVCTDENLKVVKSLGDPSAFLKNELFNFNLHDLLPDNIVITFKAAAHKALLTNERILLQGLNFNGHTNIDNVADVVIRPISSAKMEGKLLLILFLKSDAKPMPANSITHQGIEKLNNEHLKELEEELAEAKLNLEEAYERIASSNENLQSFNEELLSANEEMQSANEELQSLNEELQTINKEQQGKNTELSELNDDLNNYFRSNQNGLLFVDHDLLLKKFSPAAVRHINIRESDIGRPLSNITTNIKFETFIDDVKTVMLSNETIFREAESTDGNIYQVMTMPYIRKDSKIIDGAIISFYDITELKNVLHKLDITNEILRRGNEKMMVINHELSDRNDQLKNSRKYTEEIFNTINDPLLIMDKDMKVIRATAGFYEMFKVNEKETEGASLYDLGNKQWDIPELRDQFEKMLPKQGFFKAFEVDHEFDQIGRKIMLLTARQFDTHTHQKLTLLAINDLTDKRKVEEGIAEAERLLTENKKRLHFAIEAAGIGAWDYNPVTKEFKMDNRCKELFGLGPDDSVDYPIFLNQIHPDDRTNINEMIQKTLGGANQGEFNEEYRTVGLHDKTLRWIKSKGKAYFNEDKIVTRFIGTILDITMDRTLEENTRELLLKKDEFISIASHELKTPITTLKASLQLLRRVMNDPASQMAPKLLDQSSKSIDKIGRLIDDLLNVTRMNEGQLRLNKEPFSIAEMLSECCTHVRATGKHELILQGEDGLMIYADEDRIEQVMVNLVDNAVKYAPASVNIYLIVEKAGDFAKISVKDGGPGISPDKRDDLFNRYYRADYSGAQYSGLGLGLYISSEIIRRHGGQIGVESELGEGTTFWFTLPLDGKSIPAK